MTGDLFAEWLALGVTQGWVSLPVCDTHNGPPLTESESVEFEDGSDPCVLVMRVWPERTKNEGDIRSVVVGSD